MKHGMRDAAAAGMLAACAMGLLLAGTSRGADRWRRYAETLVVPGGQLAPLAGAMAEEVRIWAWVADGWRLVPWQIDERGEDLSFVGYEDGRLDENDLLVFPLPDGLQMPPEPAWPPSMPQDVPWVEARVLDPIDGRALGAVYVFRLEGAPGYTPENRITWDPQSMRIRTDRYGLGFADPTRSGHVGADYLTLAQHPDDLLDRLKLRLTVDLGFLGEQQITEDSLAGFLALAGMDVGSLSPDPVIDGPVRLVLDAGGAAVATRDRLSIDLSRFEDEPMPAGLQLVEARISLDLTDAAVGGRYLDANLADPVTVDGVPDSVPTGPVPVWRQLETSNMRVVFLRRGSEAAPSASVYWKDDAAADSADTGDGRSIGDQGVRAESLRDLVRAGFPGDVVVLGPEADVSAATLAENLAQPLQVDVRVGHWPATPTGEPTATRTATLEPSSTVEPTVTATGGDRPTADPEQRWSAWLPMTMRGR